MWIDRFLIASAVSSRFRHSRPRPGIQGVARDRCRCTKILEANQNPNRQFGFPKPFLSKQTEGLSGKEMCSKPWIPNQVGNDGLRKAGFVASEAEMEKNVGFHD